MAFFRNNCCRRDSFITHRAFCDALAQESARHPPSLSAIGSHLYATSNMGLGLSHQVGGPPQLSSIKDQTNHQSGGDILRLGGGGSRSSPFDHLLPPPIGSSSSSSSSFRSPQTFTSTPFFMQDQSNQQNYHEYQQHQAQLQQGGLLPNKPFHGLMQFADLQNNSSPSASNLFNLSFLSNSSNTSNIMMSSSGHHFNNNDQNGTATPGCGGVVVEGSNHLFPNNFIGDQISSGVPSLFSSVQNESMVVPHMSATVLLQKAAQMGSTSSNNNTASLLRSFGSSTSSGSKPNNNFGGGIFGTGPGSENDNSFQDLMNNPFSAAANSSIFGTGSSEVNAAYSGQEHHPYAGYNANRTTNDEASKLHQNLSVSMGGSDRMTRDFLGVGQNVRNISGGFSQREKHQQQQQQQQQGGIDVSSLDSADKNITAAPTSQTFGGGGGGIFQ